MQHVPSESYLIAVNVDRSCSTIFVMVKPQTSALNKFPVITATNQYCAIFGITRREKLSIIPSQMETKGIL